LSFFDTLIVINIYNSKSTDEYTDDKRSQVNEVVGMGVLNFCIQKLTTCVIIFLFDII